MGQYYRVVNLDLKESLAAWDYGTFAKLTEHARPGWR